MASQADLRDEEPWLQVDGTECVSGSLDLVLRSHTRLCARLRLQLAVPPALLPSLGLTRVGQSEAVGLVSQISPDPRDLHGSVRQLMSAVYLFAAASPVRALVILAPSALVQLLEGLGAERLRQAPATCEGELQHALVLIVGDIDQLARSGSPLLACEQPFIDPARLQRLREQLLARPDNGRPPTCH